MYERRRKVPMLDVAERLVQAAGADLGMVTTVVWEVHFLPGLKAFWYPDRLWRVEVPGCFDRVRMPDLVGHTERASGICGTGRIVSGCMNRPGNPGGC
jgi:hypothetical protein